MKTFFPETYFINLGKKLAPTIDHQVYFFVLNEPKRQQQQQKLDYELKPLKIKIKLISLWFEKCEPIKQMKPSSDKLRLLLWSQTEAHHSKKGIKCNQSLHHIERERFPTQRTFSSVTFHVVIKFYSLNYQKLQVLLKIIIFLLDELIA